MRLCLIACGFACASGAENTNQGPGSLGTSASSTAAPSSAGDDPAAEGDGEGDAGDSSEDGECDDECSPGDVETRPCPGMCAQQERSCADDCTWDAWSTCEAVPGECSPGETASCGMCMEQTCDDECSWGTCTEVECVFACEHAARNGSEVCDDEGFEMPDGRLFLVCEDANGGTAYVADNTGPPQTDGIPRCQGWEDMGLNAWDYLEYVHMMVCDEVGKYVEITLPAGTQSHFGVHDDPAGGGHFTQVCIATLQE